VQQQVAFDTHKLPAGVYFSQLQRQHHKPAKIGAATLTVYGVLKKVTNHQTFLKHPYCFFVLSGFVNRTNISSDLDVLILCQTFFKPCPLKQSILVNIVLR
jgi:hypothetical protein